MLVELTSLLKEQSMIFPKHIEATVEVTNKEFIATDQHLLANVLLGLSDFILLAGHNCIPEVLCLLKDGIRKEW